MSQITFPSENVPSRVTIKTSTFVPRLSVFSATSKFKWFIVCVALFYNKKNIYTIQIRKKYFFGKYFLQIRGIHYIMERYFIPSLMCITVG